MSLTVEAVRTALHPLSSALHADGYLLHVAVHSGSTVHVRVEAGPEACADCLVPKALFADILRQRLGEDGVEVSTLDVEYPEGER